MAKFFKDSVTDRVKQLLIEYPPSRDSDQKLISLYYWKYSGHEIEIMSAKTLLWLIYNEEVESAGLITRTRRKLQEHNEELRGKLWAKRQRLEKEVRDEISNKDSI